MGGSIRLTMAVKARALSLYSWKNNWKLLMRQYVDDKGAL